MKRECDSSPPQAETYLVKKLRTHVFRVSKKEGIHKRDPTNQNLQTIEMQSLN